MIPRSIREKYKNSNFLTGFTLIELIIVIVIISILAAIALPQYGRMTERSRVAEAKTILASIQRAQMRYVLEYANYADDATLLDINVTDGKFFDFAAVTGDPYGALDIVIANATRNGFSVTGGGIDDDYVIGITESGSFSCVSGTCPPL